MVGKMQATTENPPCVPHLRACGHASTRTNDNHSSTIITFMIHGWLFSTRPLEVIGTKIDLEKKYSIDYSVHLYRCIL